MKTFLFVLSFLMTPALLADEYLGKLSANPYDPDSTSNPYGAGSPYRAESPNNPHGQGLSIRKDEG